MVADRFDGQHRESSPELDELWHVVKNLRAVSPSRLLDLIPKAVVGNIDARSQLLIRDSLDALASKFGSKAVRKNVEQMPNSNRIQEIWEADYDKVGFPTLKDRLVEPTTPKQIEDFFIELGENLRDRVTIDIAGSISLIYREILIRSTEVIDVIDVVPREIGEKHELLDQLKTRYKLVIAHTASHYYPKGWENRTTSLGKFRDLEVRMLDPIDLLVAKLFSRREKDHDDLMEAWPKIDHEAFRNRLIYNTHGHRQIPNVLEKARLRWKVLTREEDLPPLSDH